MRQMLPVNYAHGPLVPLDRRLAGPGNYAPASYPEAPSDAPRDQSLRLCRMIRSMSTPLTLLLLF
jgi:hypothetical protein